MPGHFAIILHAHKYFEQRKRYNSSPPDDLADQLNCMSVTDKILVFAAGKGLSFLGGILIVAAILSTLLGAGRVAFVYMSNYFVSPVLPVLFLCLLSVISFTMNFSLAVDAFYPVIGYFGAAVCGITALSLAAASRRKLLALVKVKRRT